MSGTVYEAFRHTEVLGLQEAELAPDTRTIHNCRFLQSGLTKNRARLYPAGTVQRGGPKFTTRLLLGHGTKAQQRGQEERTVIEQIGFCENPRVEQVGSISVIRGDVRLVGEGHPEADRVWSLLSDPLGRKQAALSWEGPVRFSRGTHNNQPVAEVQEIIAVRGVAVVMDANAGGAFESLLAEEAAQLDITTVGELQAAYPGILAEAVAAARAAPGQDDVAALLKQGVADIKEAVSSSLARMDHREKTIEAKALIAESKIPESGRAHALRLVDFAAEDFGQHVKDVIVETLDFIDKMTVGKKGEAAEGSEAKELGGKKVEDELEKMVNSIGASFAEACGIELPVQHEGGGA